MMHPLWLIAAAAGAYLLGRRKQEDDKRSPMSKLPPPPEAEAAGALTYVDMWNLTKFEAEIYPADAQKGRIPPPKTPDGFSTDPACIVIAIGTSWWDGVKDYAESLLAKGETDPREIHRKIMEVFATPCIARNTPGAIALRAEVAERLQALIEGQFVSQGTLLTNPARNPWRTATQSFNPYPIYESDAYRKSSIVNYYRRGTPRRRNRTAITR